jgi:DNA recombination protein RmuC
MEVILAVVVLVLVLVMLGLLVWLIVGHSAEREKLAGQSASINLLQQQLETIKLSQDSASKAMQQSLQLSQTSIGQSMQASQKVLSQLYTQMGELYGTNKQMMQIGIEVRRLHDILGAPKLRGQMGERLLENVLCQILPKDSYHLQYAFKDGKIVDALVKMDEFCVPIDAKFPLPAFERISQTEDGEEKNSLRKQFVKDVFKHIDKIAGDYIRPAEGTVDFAIMYIPAENVYYETTIQYLGESKDIMEYALAQKVIPVSPNLLYTYLMTVVMGLHGLQIEKKAADILKNLKKLNSSFGDFAATWEVLGKHLRNSNIQYSEGQKKLDKFGMELNQIQQENEVKEN